MPPARGLGLEAYPPGRRRNRRSRRWTQMFFRGRLRQPTPPTSSCHPPTHRKMPTDHTDKHRSFNGRELRQPAPPTGPCHPPTYSTQRRGVAEAQRRREFVSRPRRWSRFWPSSTARNLLSQSVRAWIHPPQEGTSRLCIEPFASLRLCVLALRRLSRHVAWQPN